jgi:hypothetical protein
MPNFNLQCRFFRLPSNAARIKQRKVLRPSALSFSALASCSPKEPLFPLFSPPAPATRTPLVKATSRKTHFAISSSNQAWRTIVRWHVETICSPKPKPRGRGRFSCPPASVGISRKRHQQPRPGLLLAGDGDGRGGGAPPTALTSEAKEQCVQFRLAACCKPPSCQVNVKVF